ncbi:DEAD/DEAH box helicase [Flavitalea sp.]|nr:DEAD/DEAH box helicase [Flavitalea sp.]
MQKNVISHKSILSNLGIDTFNDMQIAAGEAITQNKDVILLSATGSGKTLAFLMPVIEKLDPESRITQALIIVPSRELALQIEQVFKSMGTGLKITCCYGGHKRETEENNLLQAPALIVGTPGRLADHIRRENIQTKNIEVLILDEFDKSLELGFQEEMSFIIGSLPGLRQRILTSATDASEIPDFLGLTDPLKINFLTGEPTEDLAVQYVESEDKDKLDTLFRLLCFHGSRSSVIFCNHRDAVERTSAMLTEKGIVNVFYHGAMEQQERDSALCKFRNGTSDTLVTTDLASRGLDIPNIRYIIHYHLPNNEETFTHRNGRTARMDASGTAVFILGPEEKLPGYLEAVPEKLELPEHTVVPEKPKWSTLFIAAGKKDKVNKIDIVGFLGNKGELKKEDIGLIEVKDFFSFVAVRKSKVGRTLMAIKNEKIKNKKVKIDIAK